MEEFETYQTPLSRSATSPWTCFNLTDSPLYGCSRYASKEMAHLFSPAVSIPFFSSGGGELRIDCRTGSSLGGSYGWILPSRRNNLGFPSKRNLLFRCRTTLYVYSLLIYYFHWPSNCDFPFVMIVPHSGTIRDGCCRREETSPWCYGSCIHLRTGCTCCRRDYPVRPHVFFRSIFFYQNNWD